MKLAITDHAIERYVERVMEQDSSCLMPTHYTTLREKILAKLAPHFDTIKGAGIGSYKIDGYIYQMVLSSGDLVLTTVKYTTDNDKAAYARISGGRMRSGAKIKKKRSPTQQKEK